MAQFENALFSSKFYVWCHCLINLNMHGHNIKEHAQFGKWMVTEVMLQFKY